MENGISRAPEIIETERLRLRRPRVGDAAAIFSGWASDPEVTRYLAWPRHRSIDDTLGFIIWSDQEWKAHPTGPYLVESRESGLPIGSTGLAFETASRASTGYVLARSAWGRGFATEALLAMAALAPRLGAVRLQALCHAEHRASARVLEKAGFSREGILREHSEFPNLGPGPRDVLSYALVFR